MTPKMGNTVGEDEKDSEAGDEPQHEVKLAATCFMSIGAPFAGEPPLSVFSRVFLRTHPSTPVPRNYSRGYARTNHNKL